MIYEDYNYYEEENTGQVNNWEPYDTLVYRTEDNQDDSVPDDSSSDTAAPPGENHNWMNRRIQGTERKSYSIVL